MKNKKTILAAAIASIVASASSYAKLSGAYVELSGVNVFGDTFVNSWLEGSSAIGNVSTNTLGFAIEGGYNAKFDDFLLGVGLSYIYATPKFKYIGKEESYDKKIATYLSQNINGHRINLDLNAGYSFEDKVALTAGGIISYNPGKPEYLIKDFDEKTTSDWGFGFKVGTNIKLTECVSLDVSYRMTWFSTTQEYRDFVAPSKNNDAIEVSKLNRVDKMITTGIRFNF